MIDRVGTKVSPAEREVSIYFGTQCPLIERPLFCQEREGCSNCEIRQRQILIILADRRDRAEKLCQQAIGELDHEAEGK